MGVTLAVNDPETGETLHLAFYLRGGRLVVQRLGRHLFRDGLTPRREETLAAFAEAASTAYGERMTGRLPPAAIKVKERMPALAREFRAPRNESRVSTQGWYLGLLGPAALDAIERQLRLEEEVRQERRPNRRARSA